MPVDIRQATVNAILQDRQLLVVHTQQVQHGGVEIVAIGGIRRGF